MHVLGKSIWKRGITLKDLSVISPFTVLKLMIFLDGFVLHQCKNVSDVNNKIKYSHKLIKKQTDPCIIFFIHEQNDCYANEYPSELVPCNINPL